METDIDVETFTCAYSHCGQTVTKFPLITKHDEKTCSPFCRRKREEERKAPEADSEDSVPESPG